MVTWNRHTFSTVHKELFTINSRTNDKRMIGNHLYIYNNRYYFDNRVNIVNKSKITILFNL